MEPSIEYLERRYVSGETTVQIAAACGMKPARVQYMLRTAGVRLRPRGNQTGFHPEERDAEIARRVLLGQRVREITKELKVSTATVAGVIESRGLPRHTKRHLLSAAQTAEVARLYQDGETYADLGLRYDVTTGVIRAALDEHNIKPRRGWAKYRVTRWTDRKGRLHLFKSTWERSYAQRVDSLGLGWDYEPKSFRITGVEGHRSYTPDFLVKFPEGECFVEVHAWDDVPTRTRISLFRNQHPTVPFDILGPAEMYVMGLVSDDFKDHPQGARISGLRERLSSKRTSV